MLPFLFSLGLPALASTAQLGALSSVSAPVLAGLGAGLGSFLETGDIGKGIKTGLTSAFAGKLLGGLGGDSAAKTDLGKALGGVNPATLPSGQYAENFVGDADLDPSGFLQPTLSGVVGPKVAAGITQPGVLNTAFLGQTTADLYNPPEFESRKKDENPPPDPLPPIRTASFRDRDEDDSSSEFNYFDYYRPPRGSEVDYPYRYSLGGMLGGGSTHPMFMGLGQNIARALSQEQSNKVQPFIQKVEQDAKAEFGDEIFNMPQVSSGKGQGLGLLGAVNEGGTAQRRAFENTGSRNFLTVHPDSPNAPMQEIQEPILERPSNPFMVSLAAGAANRFQSALGMAEGGQLAKQVGMNDKQVIVEAVKAIKGMSQNAEVALGIFVEKYGEEALRDLVEKVQSGALDDTIARFANGDKGMVEGPGDGSGEDDMVPATLDGEQDVLLTEGEFVIRQPTTEALENEFGNGFLDVINKAEGDAPEKLKEMVG